MIEALRAIVENITTLVNLVINIINSLINLVVKIPSYSNFLMSSINLLPIVVLPFAIAAISIYIVLFLLGR